MPEVDKVYRDLQRHLDKQAVGFPATESGVELRILQDYFSPEEASLALYLNYKPQPVSEVCAHARESGLDQTNVARYG